MRFTFKLNVKITDFLKKQVSSKLKPSPSNEELRVKIGLEIHARILSQSKIFSDTKCFDITNSPINANVAFFDAALPGTMPTFNRKCGEAALLTALALNCQINAVSFFERKHYFYADMPAGYQITQQRDPIALKGHLQYPVIDPKTKKLEYRKCDITRIQLELDSARTLNTEDLQLRTADDQTLPEGSVLIDLNRAGLGLMEIVTEPCFKSAFESYSFIRELAMVLRTLGTCEAVMSEGGFRVDVNISVHKVDKETGDTLPGTRVELKNLNSFSNVLKATEYEIERQKNLIKSDIPIPKETRTYDTKSSKTISIRTKEDQYDYRFMPEPNLLPLVVYPSNTFAPEQTKCLNNPNLLFAQKYSDMAASLGPEFHIDLDKVKEDFGAKDLPQRRRDVITSTFGLSDEMSFVFVANDLDKIMERILLDGNKQLMDKSLLKPLVSLLNFEYLNQVNSNPEFEKIDFDFKCQKIASYLELKSRGLISNRIKYKFFTMLFEVENSEKTAHELAEEKSLLLVNDRKLIEKALASLFETNEKAVNEFKSKKSDKKRAKINEYFVRILHLHFNDCAEPSLVEDVVSETLKRLV